MKKLYIKGTNILARNSKRAYGYCVNYYYNPGCLHIGELESR